MALTSFPRRLAKFREIDHPGRAHAELGGSCEPHVFGQLGPEQGRRTELADELSRLLDAAAA